MFENFKKITITGGCFETATELELFKKDTVSVVYGRNGSGKTTIAHCVGELVKPDDEKSAEYIVTSDVAIPEDKKQAVFIFDEDFVSKQVKVSREGINTIVMLGEQVELDEQIAKKKAELEKAEKERNDLKTLQDQYEDASVSFSPLYYFNKIRDGLREEGGWADIDRDLKGNTLKSRVTGDVVYGLLGLEEPKASYEVLRKQLMADMKLYLESENAEVINWKAEAIGRPGNLYVIKKMLKRPLDSPKLSEREQRLMNMVAMSSHYAWHFSQQNTRQMLDDGWTFCPLCLREIKEQDKTDITKTLTHILNKEADEYEEKLTRQLEDFAPVEVEMPDFPGNLNERELNVAKLALEQYNKVLAAVRARIEQRKRNIYERMEMPFTDEEMKTYEEVLAGWKKTMEVLTQCVEKFNVSVKKRHDLFEKIRNQNNLLARKQLNALLAGYKQAEANSNNNKKYLEEKHKKCQSLEAKVKQLVQQKERTDIALDYINKELQYVFYSNKKVKLEPGDGCYKLKVNGRNVRPSKISVGERNVLGLCYFFAKLYSGKAVSARYNSENLIVIDDPVSSFDYGNRVGVMSLLRYQFGHILRGNANSRILVMSHDLHSVFDLVKIRNEVVAGRRADQSFMELVNNKLEVKYMQNEYKKLLDFVYSYAIDMSAEDPDDNHDMSIGNVMRRMMEAYSSFCYNDSFEKMVRNEDVLALIPESKRGYYENFMCRLILNTESHMAESVYSLDTITTCFTRLEKVQTAKSVLLFWLYVNRLHLMAYLDVVQISTIEGWKTDEASWIVG